MRLLFWLTVLGISLGALFVKEADCEDCLDHRLCQSPTQCHSGCQCIPLPGRTVGQCQ